jgi:hypothetical protein
MLVRRLKRVLWYFGLAAVMGVAAVFGIPLIIDPPPRDRVVESQDQTGAPRKKRKRRTT